MAGPAAYLVHVDLGHVEEHEVQVRGASALELHPPEHAVEHGDHFVTPFLAAKDLDHRIRTLLLVVLGQGLGRLAVGHPGQDFLAEAPVEALEEGVQVALDQRSVGRPAKVLPGELGDLFQGFVVGLLDQAVVLGHAPGLHELALDRAPKPGHLFEPPLGGLVALEEAFVRAQGPAPVGGIGRGDHELRHHALGFELAGKGREPSHGAGRDPADLAALGLTPEGGEAPGDFHV